MADSELFFARALKIFFHLRIALPVAVKQAVATLHVRVSGVLRSSPSGAHGGDGVLDRLRGGDGEHTHVAREHGAQLAPEARSAETVEKKVEGVVDVADVDDDGPPHVVESGFLWRRLEDDGLFDDEIDRDGRRGDQEHERHCDEDRRHARHLDATRTLLHRVFAHVVRVGDFRDDAQICRDQNCERDEGEKREVDPCPLPGQEGIELVVRGAVVVGRTLVKSPEKVTI